jgi:hypothetical protein
MFNVEQIIVNRTNVLTAFISGWVTLCENEVVFKVLKSLIFLTKILLPAASKNEGKVVKLLQNVLIELPQYKVACWTECVTLSYQKRNYICINREFKGSLVT